MLLQVLDTTWEESEDGRRWRNLFAESALMFRPRTASRKMPASARRPKEGEGEGEERRGVEKNSHSMRTTMYIVTIDAIMSVRCWFCWDAIAVVVVNDKRLETERGWPQVFIQNERTSRKHA